MKRRCLCCLGARIHETGMLASFGCAITQNGGVCVVWGLGYAKRRCLFRLGAWLCETGMLASFGGAITRNGEVCIVWGIGCTKQRRLCCLGPGYMNRTCWRRLGVQLHEMEVFESSWAL